METAFPRQVRSQTEFGNEGARARRKIPPAPGVLFPQACLSTPPLVEPFCNLHEPTPIPCPLIGSDARRMHLEYA